MYKIIYVEWLDATWTPQQVKPSDLDDDLYIIKSIGWLAKEDKLHIMIATELHEEGKFKHIVTIPKQHIKKKKYLKL